MSQQKRWPHWIYGEGSEPDYRFSLANERTLLAWVRTALALVGGGIAVDALHVGLPTTVEAVIAKGLLVLGSLCSGAAWVQWARAERAIRRREPLPSVPITLVVCVGVLLVALAVLVAG
jgi:putative membrane protein